MEVKKAVSKDVASASRGRRGGRGASGGRGQSWGGPNNNWGGEYILFLCLSILIYKDVVILMFGRVNPRTTRLIFIEVTYKFMIC